MGSSGTIPGSGGSGTGSYVPTVFGGPGSVTAVDEPVVGTSATPKPGKDFQDHMQCYTDFLTELKH